MKNKILLLLVLTLVFSSSAYCQWELRGHVLIRPHLSSTHWWKFWKNIHLHTGIDSLYLDTLITKKVVTKTCVKKGAIVKCQVPLDTCLSDSCHCDREKDCDCKDCIATYHYTVKKDECLSDTTYKQEWVHLKIPYSRYRLPKASIEKKGDTVFIDPWIRRNSPLPNGRTQYYLLLKNRHFYNFKYRKMVLLAPIVLPYRYRFPVKNKTNSDFQKIDGVGFMPVGWTIGSMIARHTKHEDNDLYTRTFSTGPYIGFSAITMDSTNNSRILEKNYASGYPPVGKEGINVLAINIGWGLFYNYRALQLGFVVGLDHALGPYGMNWRYQSVPWIAFGVGYNFNLFKTTLTKD